MKNILLLCLCVFFHHLSHGQKVIEVNKGSHPHIGKYISFYFPEKEISLADAQKADFEPSLQAIPNLGIHDQSVWIKFSVANNSNTTTLSLDVDNATITEAELYYPNSKNGGYDSISISKRLPLKARNAHSGSTFIFSLIPPPHQTSATYYLRVRSSLPLILPISINHPQQELTRQVRKNTLNGIYLGIILVMSLYNFFLYLSIKDRNYLFYVCFILFTGLTQLSLKGITFQYLWPTAPSFEAISVTLFAALGALFAILFVKSFLNTKVLAPKLDKVLSIFIFLFLSAVVLLFLGNKTIAYHITRLTTTLASIVVLYIGIDSVIKKTNRSAVYFLIAWSVLICGSLVYLMTNYGILPFNLLTSYSMQIASASEIVLLSFALAHQINQLKKEKEASHLQALELARENEQILTQHNAILEQEVHDRTVELETKNTDLNKTLIQLKQTQTRLVSAEKMSSLGQLTAGIAHEINNPINFVSANISPLKRDIKQLFEIINKIESIGLEEGKAAAIKLIEMAAYKEEQELDYLQEEIDQLLNGIHDGASRTASIVRGLRIFSRLDEDDWKEANLNEGLQSTLAITGNILKGIEVITQFEELPPVTCYPGKLNQVFLNIITNAIFAIRAKHGNNIGGTLELKTWHKRNFVFVSIKDDGIGMDDATLSKLYDPFFTTKPVGEGTGLGMAIVFTIVEQHHAELSVTSQVGHGSEFTLKLPVDPLSSEKASLGTANAESPESTDKSIQPNI